MQLIVGTVAGRGFALFTLLIFAALGSITVYHRWTERWQSRTPKSDHPRSECTGDPVGKLLVFQSSSPQTRLLDTRESAFDEAGQVTVVYAACGERLAEAVVSIKSLLLSYNGKGLRIIVFAEPEHVEQVHQTISSVLFSSAFSKTKIELSVLKAQFPAENLEEWHRAYGNCATQRLFLPDLLWDLESVIYMDADTILTRSIGDLWQQFQLMAPSQFLAAAAEQVHSSRSWYRNKSKVPFAEPFGLNSGVLLMNLTRMRNFSWVAKAKAVYEKYKSDVQLVDQDVINIIAHYNPDIYIVLPCNWNFRRDAHCFDNDNICKASEIDQIGLFHGNDREFVRNGELHKRFSGLYRAFSQFDPNKTDVKQLRRSIRAFVLHNVTEVCRKSYQTLAKQLQ